MKKAIIPIAVFVVISIALIFLLSGFFNNKSIEDSLDENIDIINAELDIDKRNQICKQLGVDFVSTFNSGIGYALDENGYYYIDSQGRKIFNTDIYIDKIEYYPEVTISEDNFSPTQDRFSNTSSPRDLSPIDIMEIPTFVNEYLLYKYEGLYYFTNKAGILITNQGFEYAENFSDNLALIKLPDGYNYLTTNGSFLSPTQFKTASSFHNKIAIVSDEKGSFLLNTEGKITSSYFKNIFEFNDGFAIASDTSGKQFLISESGIIVPGTSYDSIVGYSEGFWIGIEDGYYYYFDSQGTRLEHGFERSTRINVAYPFYNGIAIAQLQDGRYPEIDAKYIYIDKTGKDIFKKYFINAYNFTSDVALVEISLGVHNYIDRNGNPISSNNYYFGYSFTEEGIALVQESADRYYYIDKNGNKINNEIYIDAYDFNNGVAQVVDSNSNWYLINEQGQKITSDYNYIDTYSNGAAVAEKKNGKFTYLNTNGQEITTTEFHAAFSFYQGLGRVVDEKGVESFLINTGQTFCK